MTRNSLFLIALLAILAQSLPGQVAVSQGDGSISVEIDGRPFGALFIGPDAPKPYFHPLRAASGTIVTRHYPMEKIEGEAYDHPHHRGLWFTHGDVNGFDFWANEGPNRPKSGKIVLGKVLGVNSGKNWGSLSALFEWLAPDGKPLLTERRTMVFLTSPGIRVVDCDIELTAATQVKFGDTKEGTFAIRLAAGLEEPRPKTPASPPRTGKMVTAEGRETEKNVWGTRSKWVDYFGEIDGEKLGLAILDHPSNPRHPTYWHSRSYGLFAANIFGLHDFLRDNSQDGSLTLDPGKSLRFLYRVIIHPGDYKTADIESLYRKFAARK